MPSKGKRSFGAPGPSTATGARPSKPIRENKRRRLSSLEGDKDAVSRQRCQQGLPTYRVVFRRNNKETYQILSAHNHRRGQPSSFFACFLLLSLP